MTRNQVDFLKQNTAYELASSIKQYWGLRGYYVNTKVVKMNWRGVRVNKISDNEKSDTTYIYEIKSDMINGFPKDHPHLKGVKDEQG